MASDTQLSTGTLVAGILASVLAGGALVAVVWEALNRLLSLHADVLLLVMAVPALLLLWVLLKVNVRLVERWEGERRP